MIIDLKNPNLYNPIYLDMLHRKERIRILYGGRDSGKSDFIAQATILDMMQSSFFRMILIRQEYAKIKESQFQTLVDWIRIWELQDLFHITVSPLTITYKPNPVNKIIARGLDKEDNARSIKDPTALWIEEATQISANAYFDTSDSLRSSEKGAVMKEWLSFNPEKESSWLNSYFFPKHKNSYERADGKFHYVKASVPNTVILHVTATDNLFCPQDRIDKYESYKEKDANRYKVSRLGLWGGALKGLVYPDWNVARCMPDKGDIAFGLDYGFNNPSAFVQVTHHENELFLKELIYESGLTHNALVAKIKEFKHIIKNRIIIIDSAEPALFTLLKKAGFNVRISMKGPNSIWDGIMLIKQKQINIVGDSLNLKNELESYIWKWDKSSDKAVDEPIKKDDHLMDAFRYAVQTYGRKIWFKGKNNGARRPRRERRQKNDYSFF